MALGKTPWAMWPAWVHGVAEGVGVLVGRVVVVAVGVLVGLGGCAVGAGCVGDGLMVVGRTAVLARVGAGETAVSVAEGVVQPMLENNKLETIMVATSALRKVRMRGDTLGLSSYQGSSPGSSARRRL